MRIYVAVPLLIFLIGAVARCDQWPAYQHDIRRSGYSQAKLDADRLQLDWTWRSPSPPQPAWAGPAKWDAYAGRRDLPPMRSYDLSFQPIVVDGSVYFGSSADDTLYCVDALDGSSRWSFTTDGPIRTAPAFSDGRIHFGSDDGFAYCLKAKDGGLVWKFRPAKTEKLILNNGRFIPLHPCRTGVVVDRGRAYFGCALLPWKSAYLCSVDAGTGMPQGSGTYVKKIPRATLEGPPVATADQLVFPQGRVAPRLFRRSDGADQGSLKKSSGGSIVVVTLDATLFHGPGADSRSGGIHRSSLKTREVIASHGRGNALVVADGVSYMLTDNALIASDLVKRSNKWTVACDQPYALIGVGDTLFAGGRNEVVAYRIEDGTRLGSVPVEGRAYGLAAANGRLLVSTDNGTIHCFAPGDATRSVEVGSDHSPDPTPVPPVRHDALRGRWVFQRPYVVGRTAKDLAGKLDGTLSAAARLQQAGPWQALSLDGRSQSVLLSADPGKAALPKGQITAEAWVRIDQPQQWGGIIGAVQDNGSYERGWILGIRDSRFSFAVAGKLGSGSLTYLTAERDFERGRWYHVAGCYDGTKMRLFIDGRLQAESAEQRGEINYPPKAFFEMGAYHDQDENFRLRGQLHEVRLYDKALSAEELAANAASKVGLPGKESGSKPLELAAGPWLQFTDPAAAVVQWRTDRPGPTVLEYWLKGDRKVVTKDGSTTEHRAGLSGLKNNRLYRYRIRAGTAKKDAATREFECDTFFNFTSPAVEGVQPDPFAATARVALRKSAADCGICLVLGCERAQLAMELARQSRFHVIAVDTDRNRVSASREMLRAAGVYGSRVTVRHVDDYSQLPFVGHFANLVVNETSFSTDLPRKLADEILRVLRPAGGIACIAWPSKGRPAVDSIRRWWKEAGIQAQLDEGTAGVWSVVRREALAGAADWSHQYGRADNSAFAGEQLSGVEKADDLRVQWIGRPGPRFKPDRNGRKPSPLSTAGRFFVQGLHRLAALDAYNGVVLWSLEIPDLQRFNMPRDCGNWCADDRFVYAAVRDKCWQIDAASGRVVKMHDVVRPSGQQSDFDWGVLVSHDSQLIGSAVRQGSSWTSFWGGADAGWYDARSGAVTDKICADQLFAIDKISAQTRWTYCRGVVIHSTVTVNDKRVYFVECRNREVVEGDERRIGGPKLWEDQYLVALDAYSGKMLWERPLDTEDGDVVFYMAGGTEGKLVIVASGAERFHVYGLSTDGDGQMWEQSFRWPGGKGDHGKAMSRPAIVGDRLYVRPHVFTLAEGTLLPQQMPAGGCGTYACSQRALFFRSGEVTLWNRSTSQSTRFHRLRPDCWLSTIPAAGMLLSAEGGGGCSCGSWMETSVGFLPR